MGGFLLTLCLILLGFFLGRANERAHFTRLEKDEAALEKARPKEMKEVQNQALDV